MISISFVNGERESLLASDPFLTLENAMLNASDEIDSMVSSYMKTREDYLFESSFLGFEDEEKSLYLESSKENIFKKIGDAIIEIFKKFEEMVKGVIDKLKNMGFKSKTDTEKLEKLLKTHPELKDEVVCAYKQGDLNVADAKTLKELDSAFDEIVKMSKQKDVKPDTLRGKVEAFKKKFNDIDNTKVVKAAKATSVVIGAAVAVVTFKKYVLDARKAANDYSKSCSERNDAIIKAIKELEIHGKEVGEDYLSDSLSKAQILKNIDLWQKDKSSKLIAAEYGRVDKLDKGITSFIAKHMRKESQDFIYDMDVADYTRKRREKEEAKKAFKDTRNKAYANEVGKAIYNKKYAKNVDKATQRDAENKRAGAVNYDRNDGYKDVYRRADIQAQTQDSYIRDRDDDKEAKNKNKKPQTINVKILKDKKEDKDKDNTN